MEFLKLDFTGGGKSVTNQAANAITTGNIILAGNYTASGGLTSGGSSRCGISLESVGATYVASMNYKVTATGVSYSGTGEQMLFGFERYGITLDEFGKLRLRMYGDSVQYLEVSGTFYLGTWNVTSNPSYKPNSGTCIGGITLERLAGSTTHGPECASITMRHIGSDNIHIHDITHLGDEGSEQYLNGVLSNYGSGKLSEAQLKDRLGTPVYNALLSISGLSSEILNDVAVLSNDKGNTKDYYIDVTGNASVRLTVEVGTFNGSYPVLTLYGTSGKDTKNLTLLDDNILSCTYGIEQLEELSHTDYRLDLNQGMDANLVTPEIARILSAIKWQKFIRFSCDTRAKIPAIERTVSLLNAEGIPVSKIYSYLIVTEDIRDAVTRVEELKRIGIQCIYAQAEIHPRFGIIPTPAMKEFAQRYVIKHKSYTYETWERYCERNGFDPYEADLGKSKRGGRGKRANRDTEDAESMQTTML